MANSHGVRTMNPEEADYFYVPVYPTCFLFRNFGLFDEYRLLVKEVLSYIIKEHPYWNRSRGRDHIWAFVHDFGGCLSWLDNTDHIYYKELRNSIFLSHLGDLSLGCFQTHKDIVVPPMVSDPAMYVEGRGGALVPTSQRTRFAHFRGTVHWYHSNTDKKLLIRAGYSPQYSRGVRQYILKHFSSDDLVGIGETWWLLQH